ncbi:MAG: epoxyqueuosine reductase QueH [Clostridia bacterium]|nr:epoxyqueuosine reductase QueH [Clostridia bacterium]
MENYNRIMEKTIAEYQAKGQKPRLLLHACCAPCASSVIERIKDHFDLTLYFYNPNMDGLEEYSLRANELVRLAERFFLECIIEDYNPSEFYDIAKGLEQQIEGGSRCTECYKLRLNKTAKKAKILGFDLFATTLTVSPLKDATRLNQLGKQLEEQVGVKYLASDFKKKGGYQRSVELSKELDLYRQNYCGCEFSKRLNP